GAVVLGEVDAVQAAADGDRGIKPAFQEDVLDVSVGGRRRQGSGRGQHDPRAATADAGGGVAAIVDRDLHLPAVGGVDDQRVDVGVGHAVQDLAAVRAGEHALAGERGVDDVDVAGGVGHGVDGGAVVVEDDVGAVPERVV